MTVAGPTAGVTLRRDELSDWLSCAAPRTATVLVEPAVADSDFACAVLHAVRAAAPASETMPVTARGRLGDVQALARRLEGRDVVVALGGGRVMDQAKLATAIAGTAEAAALLDDGSAGGYRFLPDRIRRAASLVAAPTTLGTGSERSQNAVMEVEDGRVLVGGSALRADLVVHDPLATRELPRSLLLGGVFEALNRTVGPFVGSGVELRRPDELVEAVSIRLATIGHDLSARHTPGDVATDDQRLEVARLGALSQTPALHAGRDPFGFKAWYLAHELSWVAGIEKSHALACVLPAVWSELLAGNTGLGSAARLRRVWAAVAGTAAGRLSADPDRGIRDLAELWDLPRKAPAGVDVTGLVARIERRWGGDQPFLGGLHPEAMDRILTLSLRR